MRKKIIHKIPVRNQNEVVGIKFSGWVSSNESLIKYASLALIVLATLLSFGTVVRNGFVNFDDNIFIYENESIRNFSVSGIFSFFTGNIGQFPPLVLTIFTVLYHFFSLDPLPYHVVNLGLHVLNSLLVFLFAYRFDKRMLAALVAGMLFGIHPLHVESVAWATELKDVLYSFFFLLGLLGYQKYRLEEGKRKYLLYSLIWFMLSCLSKGMAVVFPLVLLVIDYFILGRISRKELLEKIPFFGIALIWGLMTFVTQQSLGAVDGSNSISYFQRIFIAAYGILFYLVKLVMPLNLSAYYPFPFPSGGVLPWYFYITPLIVILLGIGVYFSGKFRKILLFGLLFYLINLLLVIQLIPVGMAVVGERYFYLSSVGLFLVMGIGIDQLIIFKPGLRTVTLIFLVIVTTGLALLSNKQVKVWENRDETNRGDSGTLIREGASASEFLD